MQIEHWLVANTERLQSAGITSARLDALVLLEDCLGQDRAQLLAHPETQLTDQQIEQLAAQLKRRAAHEPLAYIRGRSEFYGRDFYVDRRVLEPRPESETIITLLKQIVGPLTEATVIDVGTGSGALAITTQLELPNTIVMASDISEDCLLVARQNATNLGAKVTFLQGDLLEPILRQNRNLSEAILLTNLPYVPDDLPINAAAEHEPRRALFGGPDGLDVYLQLFAQIAAATTKPRFIIAESLPLQHAGLAEIAASAGYHQQIEDDFIQLLAV